MNSIPTTSPEFLGILESWLRSQPELLIIIRARADDGEKSIELFSDFAALAERIRELPPGACISAFKAPQLPLRGVVDDEFIARSLSSIPDGAEYLLVETVRTVAEQMSWINWASGTTHADLRFDLDKSRGMPVAVGLYPSTDAQTDEVVHAVVPGKVTKPLRSLLKSKSSLTTGRKVVLSIMVPVALLCLLTMPIPVNVQRLASNAYSYQTLYLGEVFLVRILSVLFTFVFLWWLWGDTRQDEQNPSKR